MCERARTGYTLIEIVVAVVVFTTGALGLAVGSAVVTREMGTNSIRTSAARLAKNRQEKVQSACRTASSGREIAGSVRSAWTVSRPDSSHLRLAGTVSYATHQGDRTDSYSLTLRCP